MKTIPKSVAGERWSERPSGEKRPVRIYPLARRRRISPRRGDGKKRPPRSERKRWSERPPFARSLRPPPLPPIVWEILLRRRRQNVRREKTSARDDQRRRASARRGTSPRKNRTKQR